MPSFVVLLAAASGSTPQATDRSLMASNLSG
jgi:hypothetical protein